jgi:hypothetical protein
MRIFEAIQNKHTSTEISCDENAMLHKQIRNIDEVNNCIDEEFSQLFKNNLLRKGIKKIPIGVWRIEFRWTEFNNDSLIKDLLKISREWYDSFIKYLQKINGQKRNIWSSEGELQRQQLLRNLRKYLPGFEYLLEYSWKLYDDDNCHEGDFIFASDYGIFIVVEVKWLNLRNEHNLRKSENVSRNDVRTQVSKYKNIALENFSGKYIAVLGATFTNNLDEITLEFIDNDEIIVQYLNEIHGPSRRYNEFQTPLSYNDQSTTSVQQGN